MNGSLAKPGLSVVIPTYRRPEFLGRLLRSLAAQTLSRESFEVIVVDDASGDETKEVLAGASAWLGNLRSLTLPSNSGQSVARNRGIEEARGGVVVFIDDDETAAPDLLERHAEALQRSDDPLLGVLGRVHWHPELTVTPFMRWLDRRGLQYAYETWLEEGPVDPPYGALYTSNVSIPKRLLQEAGGFDQRLPANEDLELGWRLWKLGFRMNYDPRAIVYHLRAIDLESFRAKMEKIATSFVLLDRIQPDLELEESWFLKGRVRRRTLMKLRLLARLRPDEKTLARHYTAELRWAYRRWRRLAAGHSHLEGERVS